MNLTSGDLELFAKTGVPENVVRDAGILRVTHQEAREQIGITFKSDHLEGIAFPFLDPEDGAIRDWTIRRDNPEQESDGRPIAKYVSPPGRRHLYIRASSAQLTEASCPVIFVEAPKSALAIEAARLTANRTPRPLIAATGGCWGWRCVRGKTLSPSGARVNEKGPLPDLDRIALTDRDAVIVFDSNVTTNENVQAARRAFASELTSRGARVRVVDLPQEDGVNGPDDYIGKHGAAAFWALVDSAKPATMKARKAQPERPKQGREVQFDEPDPWPDSVDGKALITAIAKTFSRYLALPAHASFALALWVLHAYTFSAWFTSPFLAITSPAKRCGKTLLLIVLGALMSRRLFASNVTPAVLFRTIEKYSPVLLIDEADTFIRDSDELRGVLNSGHTRTTAVAIRAVGDDHEPRAFSTWCAKAIALIGKLPGTLADRSIEIPMRRRTAGEPVERLRQDRIEGVCHDIRRQAARWASDHLAELQAGDPDVPETLNDRAADCWRPLLAIADQIGGTWPEMARKAAKALSGAVDIADEDIKVQLLADCRPFVTNFAKDDPKSIVPTKDLLAHLHGLDDRPWKEWGRQPKPITSHAIAKLLKPYDIFPASDGTARGYRADAFQDAFNRYLSPDPGAEASNRQTPNKDGGETPISKRQSRNTVDALKSEVSPMNTGANDALTVSEGGEGDTRVKPQPKWDWYPPGIGGIDGKF